MRIYLAGRLMVERPGHFLDESDLPARQGRTAFAYLVLNRHRPMQRLELADAVWGGEAPETWDTSLSALLSRLRQKFRSSGLELDIETLSGMVNFDVPADTWVDVESARSAVDLAEGAMRTADDFAAWSNATVAVSILERGFLHGEDFPWVVKERERQRLDLLRALECVSEVALSSGQQGLSIDLSRRCQELAPLRESAFRREMRALIAMGNRAEALRTYERLRTLLSEQLGSDPSPEVESVYLEALRSGPGPT